MERLRQSNTNIEMTPAIWVTEFGEVLTSLGVGHDGIRLCDFDEFFLGLLRITRVLVWMQLS